MKKLRDPPYSFAQAETQYGFAVDLATVISMASGIPLEFTVDRYGSEAK